MVPRALDELPEEVDARYDARASTMFTVFTVLFGDAQRAQ